MATKDLLTKLADAGEDALSRLGEAPGVDKMSAFATSTRDRLDELTKKVRGIDALEARVAKLEKQMAALGGSKSAPARKSGSAKRSATGKKSSAKGSPG